MHNPLIYISEWLKVILLTFLVVLTACKDESQIKPINTTKTPTATEPQPDFLKVNINQFIDTSDIPSVITRNIIQDQNNNIWFATFEGVIRYDGKSFKNMTRDMSSARFFSALEDRQGNLWFGSIGAGVYRYDGQSFKKYNTENGLVGNSVTNIYEDTSGALWFGTLTGVSCYNGESFVNFTIEQGLCDKDVNTIIQDNSGNFWIGTRGEACIYDGQSFKTITRSENNNKFYNVRHIIKDRKGHMWLGGNDGLWRYDGQEFSNITKDFTGYIYEDRAGNIWTSSDDSRASGWTLNRYGAAVLDTDSPTPVRVKTGEGMFFGILEDHAGNIWSGKLDGVYRYDGQTITDFKD